MTDIDTIRTRMRHLSDQARRTLSLADTGEAGCAECLAVAAEMQQFMVVATTGLLDLSDRTEAIGDRRSQRSYSRPR